MREGTVKVDDKTVLKTMIVMMEVSQEKYFPWLTFFNANNLHVVYEWNYERNLSAL